MPNGGKLAFAVLVACLAAAGGPSPVLALAPLEREALAAYLIKLPQFVDWPEKAFASPTDPFRLCVVGDDPFDGSLDQGAHGQIAGRHPVILLRLKNVTTEDHCHLMFISGDAQFVSQGLASVDGTPVLTVTDTQSGEKAIVTFVTADHRIHLEIDQQAALRNHLNVSSKLLDIAAPAEENVP